MKHMKRMMALMLAFVLCLSMSGMAAFAAEGKPADTSISVTGLEKGDKVNFYKVLAFDETKTTTGGWKAADGFTLTDAEIQKMLGLGADGKPAADKTEHPENYGIDAALAAKIAKMAASATAKFADITVGDDKMATHATTNVGDAGLYVAIVTPGTADYMYNPVFVAADYTAGNTNTQEAVTALSYNPESLAKKENVTLTKEVDGTADTKYDVNVGDTVNFTITSKVPAYSDAYQNPTYVITDKVEDGLEIQGTPVVTVEGITLEAADYTTAVAADKKSFTVTMNASGLEKVAAVGTAQAITVKYGAKVISLEDATVTEKENEATVKFSNNPKDSTKYGLLEDKTRNYTFTIDGNLLGYDGESYETDELVKTGKNADGTDAFATKKYHSGTTWKELSPLAGAKFALFKENPAAADYASEAAAKDSDKLYTNSVFKGIVTSDDNGRLKIEGLDAGTYYLREVSAPTGFIADNRTFTITINATYTEIPGGEYTNGEGIKVKYDKYKVLDGYTVAVNDGTGTTTSTYTIENKGDVHHKVVDKATYQKITGEDFAGDSVTPINNTKGTELPSTGGMGTTMFYVVGSALVIGAAVLLISKRRMAR